MAVVAFADEDVANHAAGMDFVDAAAGLSTPVGQANVSFAGVGVIVAEVPSLRGVDLGMMPARTFYVGLLQRDHFIGRIEVKNALARVAID